MQRFYQRSVWGTRRVFSNSNNILWDKSAMQFLPHPLHLICWFTRAKQILSIYLARWDESIEAQQRRFTSLIFWRNALRCRHVLKVDIQEENRSTPAITESMIFLFDRFSWVYHADGQGSSRNILVIWKWCIEKNQIKTQPDLKNKRILVP